MSLTLERHVVGLWSQRLALFLLSTVDWSVLWLISGLFYIEEGSTVWQVLSMQSGSRVLVMQTVSS